MFSIAHTYTHAQTHAEGKNTHTATQQAEQNYGDDWPPLDQRRLSSLSLTSVSGESVGIHREEGRKEGRTEGKEEVTREGGK